MYNTKFVCTYNTPDVFSVDDNISDDEKKFVRDVIYRQELLNILGMEDFNKVCICNCLVHEQRHLLE